MSYFTRQHLSLFAKWDETLHPRGKTSAESNSGSFAPTGSDHAALHEKARALSEPHLRQKIRGGGETGWDHTLRVAASLDDPTLKLIAYLHDLVEDSPVTVEEVRAQFGARVAAAVDALTKRKAENEPLEHYLARVVANPDALRVKVADMSDNMNVRPEAMNHPKVQMKQRQYREIFPRLQAALNGSMT